MPFGKIQKINIKGYLEMTDILSRNIFMLEYNFIASSSMNGVHH